MGASAIVRAEMNTAGFARPVEVMRSTNLRLVANAALPLFSDLLTIRSSQLTDNLLKRGGQEFRLDNGALGKIVYIERGPQGRPDGFYLGFALKNQHNDQYTIHGRVAFDIVYDRGGAYVQGGYETVRALKLEEECPPLRTDSSTPIFVSDGIKEGYRGIGSSLMQIALRLSLTMGMNKMKILLSLNDEFYSKLNFKKGRGAEWNFGLTGPELKLPRAEVRARPSITAEWRPEYKETAKMDQVPADDPDILSGISFISRIKQWFLGAAPAEAT